MTTLQFGSVIELYPIFVAKIILFFIFDLKSL
jgi:hypothetical protein